MSSEKKTRVKIEFDLPAGINLDEYRASLVVYKNWNPERKNDSYSFINIKMEEKKKNGHRRRKKKKLGKETGTDPVHAESGRDKSVR